MNLKQNEKINKYKDQTTIYRVLTICSKLFKNRAGQCPRDSTFLSFPSLALNSNMHNVIPCVFGPIFKQPMLSYSLL